jgi:hypothetical protein
MYGFPNNETLMSYVPKQNKAVQECLPVPSKGTDGEMSKPEIIVFYNKWR